MDFTLTDWDQDSGSDEMSKANIALWVILSQIEFEIGHVERVFFFKIHFSILQIEQLYFNGFRFSRAKSISFQVQAQISHIL